MAEGEEVSLVGMSGQSRTMREEWKTEAPVRGYPQGEREVPCFMDPTRTMVDSWMGMDCAEGIASPVNPEPAIEADALVSPVRKAI
jgi:hypothetical protein